MYKKIVSLLIAMLIASVLVVAILPEASAMTTGQPTNVIKPMTVSYFSPIPSGTVTQNQNFIYGVTYYKPSWATRIAAYLFPSSQSDNVNFVILEYNSNNQQVGAISCDSAAGDKYIPNQPVYLISSASYVKIQIIGSHVTGTDSWYMSGLWFS